MKGNTEGRKASRAGFWHFVKYASLSIIFILGVYGIAPTRPPDNGETKKPFVLAYIDTGWKLRIRWSEDGVAWSSASGGNPGIDRGPGIAADDHGVLYLSIFEDSVSKARMMMGLGPANWDSSFTTIGDGHAGEIDSGTSIAHVEDQNWLVAYVHQNRAKVVPFDSSSSARDFGADITPVPAVVNNNLTDRPALANLNGRVLVSWLMTNQLQMVTGDIQAGQPVWQPGYLFSANVTEQGFGPPVGAHDIAHDGRRFYAAVVRQRDPLPGEQLQHHFLFVYTSDNGLNWTKLASRETMNPQSLSMAARGTDDVIVIMSRQATQMPPAILYRFNGSSWSHINDSNVIFGGNPMNKGHDFTLYAKG